MFDQFSSPVAGAPVSRRIERELLLTAYYDEFRRIARRVLAGDYGSLQIRPTDLVHEAAVRILASDGMTIRDKAHFLALGVRVMRMTLIDEVRRRNAAKRGGHVMTLWDERVPQQGSFDLEAFDDALEKLAEIEPDGAKVVELRFFAGLTMEEIGGELATSESTVHRRWRTARAWLLRELQESP